MVLVVKNPAASAGGIRDVGSIPGSGTGTPSLETVAFPPLPPSTTTTLVIRAGPSNDHVPTLSVADGRTASGF